MRGKTRRRTVIVHYPAISLADARTEASQRGLKLTELKDEGDRQMPSVPSNILDRQFEAERPNQKWIADFTTSGPPRAGCTCRP